MTGPEHTLRLRILYCGGCNPEIDRGKVVQGLRQRMAAGGWAVRLVGKEEEGDCTLLVNGCTHACLEEEVGPALRGPLLSVEGALLDHRPVGEDALPQAVWEKMQSFALARERP